MYEYLIGDFLLLSIWATFFIYRKDLRVPMVFVSLIFTIGGILSPAFRASYWNPATVFNLSPGLEDFLYAFGLAGVAWSINKVIFRNKLTKIKNYNIPIFILIIPIIAFFATGILALVNYFFKLYLIYIWIALGIAIALVEMYLRKDLIKEMISGSILFTFVYSIVFLVFINFLFPGIIQRIWSIQNLLGISVFNLPIEEILNGFAMSLMINPVYEIFFGYRVKKI